MEVKDYANWEESCLVKFSEFLGFPTVGNEEELINMLRKLNNIKYSSGTKEYWGPSKSVRELRKLECTINYNDQGGGKVSSRDRGNLLLKLK